MRKGTGERAFLHRGGPGPSCIRLPPCITMGGEVASVQRRRKILLLEYNKSFQDKRTGYVHSIDMIRLKIKFKKQYHEELYKWLLWDTEEYSVDHQVKPSAIWSDLWNVKDKDGHSWTVAKGLKTPTKKDALEGWLQFNPNKCFHDETGTVCENFIRKLYGYLEQTEIQRIDYAVDMPIEREQCVLMKGESLNYKFFYERGSATEYVGTRGNGYVKLYDKRCESDLKTPTTRCEVTLDIPYKEGIPNAPVGLLRGVETAKVSATLKALCMALHQMNVNNLPTHEILMGLDSRTRKKITDAATSIILQPFDKGIMEKLLERYQYITMNAY